MFTVIIIVVEMFLLLEMANSAFIVRAGCWYCNGNIATLILALTSLTSRKNL